MTPNNREAVHLKAFQSEFFRNVIHRIITESVSYYDERLVAIYVHGSVYRNEAVPGVSDVDSTIFINDARREEDKTWRFATNDRLQAETPQMGWHWIPPATPVDVFSSFRAGTGANIDAETDTFLRGRAWTHLLRDDSTLVYGQDLAQELPNTRNDRTWARAKLQLPHNVVRSAAGLPCVPDTPERERNLSEWPLPKEPHFRLRKLARLGVLGGAYLLMARGQFVSYKGFDVLPTLSEALPEWKEFLEETERLYITPTNGTPNDVADFLTRLVPWMDWVSGQVNQG